MYYNLTELRHFNEFISSNSNLNSAILNLLGPGRYSAITEEDRETLRQIGLTGVSSGTNTSHIEIGHKTAQFISFVYELDEIQYIRLERFYRSFETVVNAVINELIHSGRFNNVIGLQCLYNPNNETTLSGKVPFTHRLAEEGIEDHLSYIRDYAMVATETEKEAAMLLSYKLRHCHISEFTVNMMIMRVQSYKCNIFTL